MRILSLDTSLTKSGWAILSVNNRKVTVEDYGLIKTNAKLTDGKRLRQIHDQLLGVIAKYPDIERTIPIEEGIMRFAVATKQVSKARGIFEFTLDDYEFSSVGIQSVKSWATTVTSVKAKGSKETKANVEQAVKQTLGLDEIRDNKGGDCSDAIAVGIVYLKREGAII